MTIFKLTGEAIKTQEDQIRHSLSHFIREFPGTYVSLMAANFYLRITEETNQDALVTFYAQDFPALTDIVQESIERNFTGTRFPLMDYQRVILYKSLAESQDQPYLVVKENFRKLEHLLNIG